ncbi:antitoxin [Streptomyces bacillaris]|uniref:antitoxin n=1 Tax=Streptomyces bacillaris TaxID=68179 RepID=UPI0036F57DE3
MGVFDKIRSKLHMSDDTIDRAGDKVDEKTGGKFTDKVDKAQEAAKDAMGKIGRDQQDKKEP